MTLILLTGYMLFFGIADMLFARQKTGVLRCIVYIAVMALGFILCMASHMQWKLTNPVDDLARFFRIS